MIWFTSDTHFGHENVLKFTDRPWETIWQMNDAIVDNINGRVAVDDELYILGEWFAGVDEPCDRVKWPWWVNETGDRQVERELAAYKRKEQS